MIPAQQTTTAAATTEPAETTTEAATTTEETETTETAEPTPLPGLPADLVGYETWSRLNEELIPPRSSDPHNGTKQRVRELPRRGAASTRRGRRS